MSLALGIAGLGLVGIARQLTSTPKKTAKQTFREMIKSRQTGAPSGQVVTNRDDRPAASGTSVKDRASSALKEAVGCAALLTVSPKAAAVCAAAVFANGLRGSSLPEGHPLIAYTLCKSSAPTMAHRQICESQLRSGYWGDLTDPTTWK